MRSNTSIRKPALANANNNNNKGNLSIGEKLSKARRDLFFRRCILGIICALLVTIVIMAFVNGFVDVIIDKFYQLLG